MEHLKLTNEYYSLTISSYFADYVKSSSADCILYSIDGSPFKIPKVYLGQTPFLRRIISSFKNHCCGILEIICPCTKNELAQMANFLCTGEIKCEQLSASLEIIGTLKTIFGFPDNLYSILSLKNEIPTTCNKSLDQG